MCWTLYRKGPSRNSGAPAFPAGARLRCLRLGDGEDWQRGPPELEDGTGSVLDPVGRVLQLLLQAVQG